MNNSSNVEDVIQKLNERLGINIDRFSYDYDIINTILEFVNKGNELVDEFIDNYNFENLRSNNLDRFFNVFGINRMSGNNDDLFTLDVKYINPNNTFNILKNCIIKYNDDFFQVLKDVIINSENSNIVVQKVFQYTAIAEPLFTNDGLLSFDKNFISSTDDVNLETEFSQNMFFVSITKSSNEIESDFEYLERSKNILQFFGFSNEKKIEQLLLQDKRIKSIDINSLNGSTNITIFPYKLEELDEIIKYNKYVVDYYKNSNIILIKPNLVEFNISGLFIQLIKFNEYEMLKDKIIGSLNSTLSLINSESTIKRDHFINTIKNVIKEFTNIDDKISYNNITVNYKYYFRNNYNISIFGDYLDEFTINKTDVITLGKVV